MELKLRLRGLISKLKVLLIYVSVSALLNFIIEINGVFLYFR